MTSADRLDEIVAKYPGDSRAERVRLALRDMAGATSYALVVMCELAYEVKRHRYWMILRRADGSLYRSVAEFLREAFGRDLKNTSLEHRVNLGWALHEWPSGSREWLRRELSELGWTRAKGFITPIRRLKGDCETIGKLIDRAKELPTWEQVRAMLADEMLTHRPYFGQRANMCPACGRVMRTRRLNVQRAPRSLERTVAEIEAAV